MRILAGVADAEIEGQPRDEQPTEAALPKVSGEPGLRPAVVLVERRIGIDLTMVALAQHQLRMGNLQIPAQFGALRPLNAVVRPQDLRAIGDVDRLIWLAPGMRGRERLVRRRMPVLCEHHMRETCG
jgi:hypothetical protein